MKTNKPNERLNINMSSLPFISHHLFVSAAAPEPNRSVQPRRQLPAGFEEITEQERLELLRDPEVSALTAGALVTSLTGGDTT